MDNITTIKELTKMLTEQLNDIVKETFGEFPKLIVYAENTENVEDKDNLEEYNLNVIYAPLNIDTISPKEKDHLKEVLQWSKQWLKETLS